jgi:trk system potassium uptake protein TrkH
MLPFIALISFLFSLFLIFPLLIAWINSEATLSAFAITAFIAFAISSLQYLMFREKISKINPIKALHITAISWLQLSIIGALPFVLMPNSMSYVDAIFESVSGITTTGATVMSNLDNENSSILLWRSILQWVGGIGIIITALAILPMTKAGGMELFSADGGDNNNKITSKVKHIAIMLLWLYLGITILCIISYNLAGMGLFDAINHAFTTIATGGFSTKDASMSHFAEHILWISTFFIIISSLPFILYLGLTSKGGVRKLVRDSQIKLFITIYVVISILIIIYRYCNEYDVTLNSLITHSFFNVASVISGTGYASDDYMLWGTFPVMIMFTIMLMGGCAGSTSCGLKMFRIVILVKVFHKHMKKLVNPHRLHFISFNRKPLSTDIQESVLGFFFIYLVFFFFLSFVISWYGLDFITSMSAAASAIANVGPGLGDIIGPTGTFYALPDGVKIWFIIGMIFGRLEFFAFIILGYHYLTRNN